MDTKEFKKQKKELETEFLHKMLTLADEAGVELKGGELVYRGTRTEDGTYIQKPLVKLRFEI